MSRTCAHIHFASSISPPYGVCVCVCLCVCVSLSLSLSMGKFSPKFTPFTWVWFVSLISDKVQVVGLSCNWMKKIRSPWVESRNNILAFFSFFLSHWIVF
jgi:hypothetical protein